jgi:hypothetical protein
MEKRIPTIIRLERIGELGKALPVTSNVVPSSPILSTLVIEAIRFSKTSVLTRTTQRHITEDDILHEEWCLLGCYAVWLF